MSKLIKGVRVRHLSKSAWGVGQLLEDQNSEFLRVFFEGCGEVTLHSIARNKLSVVDGIDAQSLILDNMLLPKTGHAKQMLNLDDVKTQFLQKFPGGLRGPRMMVQERNYKDRLSKLSHQLFDKAELTEMLQSGKYKEVAERAGQIIKHKDNNFPASFEKMRISDGLKNLIDPQPFAHAFCEWVLPSTANQVSFEAFATQLDAVGCAKWPVISSYRYLLHPTVDVMIKPENLQKAAALCGFEINYKPALNWLTYASVQDFYGYIKKKIADLEPQDMIDVQNFIWCIDPDQYPN